MVQMGERRHLALGPSLPGESDWEAQAEGSSRRYAEAEGFAEVQDIVLGRCSICHSAEPGWEGLQGAPKGVHLDSAKGIAENAKAIYLQAGLSRAMLPADLSFMEESEREVIRRWFRAATEG